MDLENYFVKGSYIQTQRSFLSLPLIYPASANKKTLGIHNVESFSNKLKFGPTATEVNEIDYNITDQEVEQAASEVRKNFYGLEEENILADTAGIRSKIKHHGELHYDFWIKGPIDHGLKNYYECVGIDSPGLTSCFAIADYVVEKFSPN